MIASGRLRLRDGQHLAWTEWGDPRGRPVLYCHGFPSCSLEAAFTERAAASAGIRVIAGDRPGYRDSSPRPWSVIADGADDAARLLDARGVPRAGIVGISGGAPYALAAAARRPERVTAVALAGPLGPIAGDSRRAGLSPLGELSARLARRHPAAQAALFHAAGALLRLLPGLCVRSATLRLPRRDRDLLTDPVVRRAWITALRGGVQQGAGPAIREMRRYVRGWGFDLADVRCPVHIWHGDADRVVAPAHAAGLARALAGVAVERHCVPGGGHFSVPIEYASRILRAAAGGSPR